MPTKKQRRRRQKSLRHDWEYVYVDEEGQEVEVDPAELRPAKKNEERSAKAAPAARAGTSRAGTRTGRAIEPPSWRRVGRRALLMAPIFIAAMMFLNRSLPVAQRIAPAVFLLLFFIPFSYFTDSLAYRMYRKRVDRQDTPKAKAR